MDHGLRQWRYARAVRVLQRTGRAHVGYRRLCHRWRGAAVLENRDNPGNGPERPFCTPWISLYNTATASITPYLDILRDDSTTAYKDTEVWAEFAAKTAGASPISTIYSDAGALLSAGTNQASSSLGAGDWTGESGTNWYGKCDSGAAFTPAENGEILGRICVAVASTTLRIDPEIKT